MQLTRLLHSLLNSVQILPVELYITYISPNVLQDWSEKTHFREEGENREAGKLSEMTHISIKQADMRKDCGYNGHLHLFVPRPEPYSFEIKDTFHLRRPQKDIFNINIIT